ncbi:hypothetical protein AX774_g1657 [Zancudomyces culisetae]|uniref:Uncharacterized protein n=1 Tax=Zancudomyces culisetae TaxID=1213189 RepID=A0A1R1PV46_ZANCU|nr:hypothetical protein AX774_g1657 [Zancudomyces culisetae]|eukprot:OMH84809.1 hypothetical protein AX774_g1657 [Zancudomyces culisetae]
MFLVKVVIGNRASGTIPIRAAVIQRDLLATMESGGTPKNNTTCGNKSPKIIKYDTETPKHFSAMAKSKSSAALGYVSPATAKKEDFLPGTFSAHRASR